MPMRVLERGAGAWLGGASVSTWPWSCWQVFCLMFDCHERHHHRHAHAHRQRIQKSASTNCRQRSKPGTEDGRSRSFERYQAVPTQPAPRRETAQRCLQHGATGWRARRACQSGLSRPVWGGLRAVGFALERAVPSNKTHSSIDASDCLRFSVRRSGSCRNQSRCLLPRTGRHPARFAVLR